MGGRVLHPRVSGVSGGGTLPDRESQRGVAGSRKTLGADSALIGLSRPGSTTGDVLSGQCEMFGRVKNEITKL